MPLQIAAQPWPPASQAESSLPVNRGGGKRGRPDAVLGGNSKNGLFPEGLQPTWLVKSPAITNVSPTETGMAAFERPQDHGPLNEAPVNAPRFHWLIGLRGHGLKPVATACRRFATDRRCRCFTPTCCGRLMLKRDRVHSGCISQSRPSRLGEEGPRRTKLIPSVFSRRGWRRPCHHQFQFLQKRGWPHSNRPNNMQPKELSRKIIAEAAIGSGAEVIETCLRNLRKRFRRPSSPVTEGDLGHSSANERHSGVVRIQVQQGLQFANSCLPSISTR